MKGEAAGPGECAGGTTEGNVAKLLEVENLQTHFETSGGLIRAVDGISYEVGEGETVAVVGESGCGKSVGALSILRLIPNPPGRVVGGSIRFNGRDLLTLSETLKEVNQP